MAIVIRAPRGHLSEIPIHRVVESESVLRNELQGYRGDIQLCDTASQELAVSPEGNAGSELAGDRVECRTVRRANTYSLRQGTRTSFGSFRQFVRVKPASRGLFAFEPGVEAVDGDDRADASRRSPTCRANDCPDLRSDSAKDESRVAQATGEEPDDNATATSRASDSSSIGGSGRDDGDAPTRSPFPTQTVRRTRRHRRWKLPPLSTSSRYLTD